MVEEYAPVPLWASDTGTLPERSRRALLELVKGPYLSRSSSQRNWETLLADETSIRSRLNDLFLELIIDRESEFAFVRNAVADEIALPKAARTVGLAFVDTLMLLELRRVMLISREVRPYVDREDIFHQLQNYRPADKDEVSFRRHLNAAWGRMQKTLRVLHPVGKSDDRCEISPVIRLIVDAEQAHVLQAAFEKLAGLALMDESDEQE